MKWSKIRNEESHMSKWSIYFETGKRILEELTNWFDGFCWLLQTREAKKVMGNYYREPRKSGPIPFHLVPNLVKSLSRDHYVSDTGDIVYYQTDDKLFSSTKIQWWALASFGFYSSLLVPQYFLRDLEKIYISVHGKGKIISIIFVGWIFIFIFIWPMYELFLE